MNWRQNNIDLGTLKVHQVTQVVFDYIGDHPEYIEQGNIKVGCGCSVANWNPETNQLIITYTPNPIPHHLLAERKHSYHSEKYAIVNYTNGQADKLIFTATITK